MNDYIFKVGLKDGTFYDVTVPGATRFCAEFALSEDPESLGFDKTEISSVEYVGVADDDFYED